MIPVDPETVVPYVPRADREKPEAEQSVFLIRPLTHREDSAIQAKFGGFFTSAAGEMRLPGNSGLRAAAVISCGLVGWRNFPPGSGENHGFTVTKPGKREDAMSRELADYSLSLLPAAFRVELANAISDGLGLTPAAAGKSAPPSES